MWLYFMRVSPHDHRVPLTAGALKDYYKYEQKVTSPRFITGCEATPDLRQALR